MNAPGSRTESTSDRNLRAVSSMAAAMVSSASARCLNFSIADQKSGSKVHRLLFSTRSSWPSDFVLIPCRLCIQYEVLLDGEQEKAGSGKPLDGMSIVATGTIEGFGRADIEEFIVKHGGKASGSVSKKTACVIAGTNAGSKLQKAESLGIPVYDIQAFRAKYGI